MTTTTPQDASRTSHRSTDDDHCTLADQAFHLIGIGGTGASVVAQLLAARGAQVSGSDAHGGPAFDHLIDLGITIHLGHGAANVPERNTVVVSTAIKETSPEFAEARQRGQDAIHRSQALALAARGLDFVVMTGVHSETTTSDMLTETLTEAETDPSFTIGGVVQALGTGTHLDGDPVLVTGADESDRFFLSYTPHVEIVTNVEPGHLDSCDTAEVFKTASVDFVHRLVPGGLLVVCAVDADTLCLAQSAATEGLRVVTYSFAGPDTLPGRVLVREGRIHLDIQERGASSTRGLLTLTTAAGRGPAGGAGKESHHGPVELVLAVPGDHVTFDATGAWTTGIELGVESTLMARALGTFGGTGRRFEDQGEADGVRVIDDHAHHPTEIEALLRMARGMAQGRDGRVLILFQPHLFSRTRAFADRLGQALTLADAVVVTDVYPARETQASFPDITGDTVAQHVPNGTARFVAERPDATHAVTDLAHPGDLLLTVDTGDVTGLVDTVLGDLATREGDATPSPADRDERA